MLERKLLIKGKVESEREKKEGERVRRAKELEGERISTIKGESIKDYGWAS